MILEVKKLLIKLVICDALNELWNFQNNWKFQEIILIYNDKTWVNNEQFKYGWLNQISKVLQNFF